MLASALVGRRAHAATLRAFSTAAPRPVLQSATVTDVAAPQDIKGGTVSETGDVLLVDKTLTYRALQLPTAGLKADLRGAMASSDEPLKHVEADAAKFFSLERSIAFPSLFYHMGMCGKMRQEKELKTAAAMVRTEGLALRDELLWRAARAPDEMHSLKGSSGLVLTGDQGCGKSWALNYAAAACEAAGWLVVLAPWAADWTMGVGALSPKAANEAYRVADRDYFRSLPPELAGTALYDSPDASIGFLQSVYFSQREKLERLPIKGEERKAAYASVAGDRPPTLADILFKVAHGDGAVFNDFPVPVRPTYDFLQELRTVTDVPVLLAVDGWNLWRGMASSREWRSPTPLHARQLLVPSLLGTLDFGAGMQNGIMLCAVSHSPPDAPATPSRLRKHFPPPTDWARPQALREPFRSAVRHVPAFSGKEMHAMLNFYCAVGHVRNVGLQPQLESGELARKVMMMTGGVGDDVFKLCGKL